MHPYLVEQLAEARRQDILAAAERPARRLHGSQQHSECQHGERQHGSRSPRGSARNRAGWLLVEIGLRLARGPGGA
jgi:hypothetical protein